MSFFDYSVEAGLYCAKNLKFGRKALGYKRFPRAAEAIRFAMEDLPAEALRSCTLEVAEDTYFGAAIRGLYESADFPLPRREKGPDHLADSPKDRPPRN